MKMLNRAVQGVLSLIYPKRAVCMSCGSAIGCDADWLCEDCRIQLTKNWIGAKLPPVNSGLDGAAYAYWYRGPAGGLVRNLKYCGVYRLADLMAESMVRAFQTIGPTHVEMVVPVPMNRKRMKRRGLNQSEVLAKYVATKLGIPCENALERVRNTRQQARLSDEQRLKNLIGAFVVREPVVGKRVLLVDDVYTTGATARICAETLRAGGAANVYLLCFAKA